ncbi:hypothetical protein RJ640_013866 [Escallonia rubra]|uniref:Reverse transcriptase Ty1/copia-type domain-containing protein n=1 Tax=Escallonia rubra TaxID=112253 RepID=A0AA88UV17_9ASTE|nr:hypothetical protein RJ640_013866 [Escallonia rubra]
MVTKNVIADLVKGEKLNGDNYDVWHKKMKFVLNEQELEEHLTKEIVAPTEAQPLRDHTAYQKWNQKDRSAHYTFMMNFQLVKLYGTSTTRLHSLVIKFEEYTKDPKHTMSEHLRVMSNMIGKLRDAGHALTDEQQVRVVIRSLLASWANTKQILTHSENIKNFSDVSQHVILEAKTRDVDKTLTYVAQEGSRNANGKCGRQTGNDMSSIVAIKQWLSSTFEMKDMGEANYVLGVKIVRDRPKRLLDLSQETYIKKVIERFRMHNSKPIDTPMDKACTLTIDQCPKNDEKKNQMSKVPYTAAKGSLMYAMLCTRPDICYAVEMVLDIGQRTLISTCTVVDIISSMILSVQSIRASQELIQLLVVCLKGQENQRLIDV